MKYIDIRTIEGFQLANDIQSNDELASLISDSIIFANAIIS